MKPRIVELADDLHKVWSGAIIDLYAGGAISKKQSYFLLGDLEGKILMALTSLESEIEEMLREYQDKEI